MEKPLFKSPEARPLEEQQHEELDRRLDAAIEMTFPASDPIALHPHEAAHASNKPPCSKT